MGDYYKLYKLRVVFVSKLKHRLEECVGNLSKSLHPYYAQSASSTSLAHRRRTSRRSGVSRRAEEESYNNLRRPPDTTDTRSKTPSFGSGLSGLPSLTVVSSGSENSPEGGSTSSSSATWSAERINPEREDKADVLSISPQCSLAVGLQDSSGAGPAEEREDVLEKKQELGLASRNGGARDGDSQLVPAEVLESSQMNELHVITASAAPEELVAKSEHISSPGSRHQLEAEMSIDSSFGGIFAPLEESDEEAPASERLPLNAHHLPARREGELGLEIRRSPLLLYGKRLQRRAWRITYLRAPFKYKTSIRNYVFHDYRYQFSFLHVDAESEMRPLLSACLGSMPEDVNCKVEFVWAGGEEEDPGSSSSCAGGRRVPAKWELLDAAKGEIEQKQRRQKERDHGWYSQAQHWNQFGKF